MKEILVFMLFVCCFQISLAQNKAQEAYNQGITLLRQQNFVKAEEKFSLAIENTDNQKILKMSYIFRAFALNEQSKFDKAIKDFDKAIEIDPNDLASYIDRGKTYAYQKDYDNAIKDFEKVVETSPKGSQAEGAYYYLGRIYSLKYDSKKAVKYFDKLIELSPKDAEAYFLRGVAKGNLLKPKEAIVDYDLAIKYNPNYMEAYANRGVEKINLIPIEDKIGKIDCLEEPCADLLKARKLGDNAVKDMIELYCKKCK